jgi:CRISPR-associated protein Cas2
MTPAQLVELREKIKEIIDFDQDSVRIYKLGNNLETRVEHMGSKIPYDPEGALIF